MTLKSGKDVVFSYWSGLIKIEIVDVDEIIVWSVSVLRLRSGSVSVGRDRAFMGLSRSWGMCGVGRSVC